MNPVGPSGAPRPTPPRRKQSGSSFPRSAREWGLRCSVSSAEAPAEEDAERPGGHSHAQRGNEGNPRPTSYRFPVAGLALALASMLTVRAASAQNIVINGELGNPQIVVSDSNFDQWIYGNGRNAESLRSKLETLLNLQVDDAQRTCKLSDTQKRKLLLAGRGDIKRIFDKIEDKRDEFHQTRFDRENLGSFLRDIQPLRMTANDDPFQDDSLFAKTFATILTADQAAAHTAALQEKQRFRHEACVDLVVRTVDRALALSADQRRRFVKLLVDETRPPRKSSHYDYHVVMLQASKLPEEKLRPLFAEAQWRALSRYFDQAKRMEPFLRNQGLLPDEANWTREAEKGR